MTFYHLNKIIKLIENDKMYCNFQYRPGFSIKNYGDIPEFYNKADGDPWDIFAPGYTYELPIERLYQIKHIIGIYVLENGNHKIAIRVFVPGFNKNIVDKQIKTYCNNYSKLTKIKGRFLYF